MKAEPRPHPRHLCRCCEAAHGTLADPNLGRVCVECYHELVLARGTLKEIGPRMGIGPCSNEVEH